MPLQRAAIADRRCRERPLGVWWATAVGAIRGGGGGVLVWPGWCAGLDVVLMVRGTETSLFAACSTGIPRRVWVWWDHGV